jgi:uncharacterized protein
MIFKSSKFEAATRQLMLLTYRFRAGVVTFWGICALLAMLMLPRLSYDGSVNALLPADHPRVRAALEIQERIVPARTLAFILEGADFDVLVRTGRELFEPLLKSPSPWLNALELDNAAPYLYRHALLLLTASELEVLIEEHIRQVESINPFFMDFDVDSEPFDTDGRSVSRGNRSWSGLSHYQSMHDYLQAELGIPPRFRTRADSSLLVIEAFAGPALAGRGEFELDDIIRARLETINRENESDIRVHSNLKHWQDSQRLDGISLRILWGSQLSLVAILLFLWGYLRYLVHRRCPGRRVSAWLVPKLLISIVIVLGLTVVLTLGVASAAGWTLNRFSVLLLGIMLGVNADYLIHMASASVDFRQGSSMLRWIVQLSRKTGKGMAFSLWTTAAAMTGLLFSGFPGFQSFGALFLIGLVLNYLLTFTLFLLMLEWLLPDFSTESASSHQEENDFCGQATGSGVLQQGTLQKTAPAEVGEKNDRWHKPALLWRAAVLFILAAWGGWAVSNLSFRYDLSGLEPRSGEQQEFSGLYYNTVNYLDTIEPAFMLLRDITEAREVYQQIHNQRSQGTAFTQVRRIESLVHRIPVDTTELSQRVSLLEQLRGMWLDNNGELRVALNWEPHEQEYLIQALHATDKIIADSLSYRLSRRFFDETGEPLPLIAIYPDNSLSSPERSLAFKRDSGTLFLNDGSLHYPVSSALMASSVLELLQSELPVILMLAILGMFFGAWMAFGRLSPAIWSCLATMGGFGLTFAVLKLTGFELHLYNAVALPLLIGIGIDSSIHLMHSLNYTLEGNRPWSDVSGSTLVYVSASALTTMLGFFGFLWIGYRGLMDLAVLAMGGTFAILLYTTVLLNTLFLWQQYRKNKSISE